MRKVNEKVFIKKLLSYAIQECSLYMSYTNEKEKELNLLML